MQIAQRAPKTQSATIEITPKEILELKFFLAGLLMANKAFSETVAWWQTKNEKKLNQELKKCQAADKATDDKFCAKDEKGRFKLWDRVEGGFACFLKEYPDGNTEYVDANDEVIPIEKEMYFVMAEGQTQEDYDKVKDDFATSKRKVHGVQINRMLIENLNIPTMGSTGQNSPPRKLNRELFYDTLVMPDADDQEESEETTDEGTGN